MHLYTVHRRSIGLVCRPASDKPFSQRLKAPGTHATSLMNEYLQISEVEVSARADPSIRPFPPAIPPHPLSNSLSLRVGTSGMHVPYSIHMPQVASS